MRKTLTSQAKTIQFKAYSFGWAIFLPVILPFFTGAFVSFVWETQKSNGGIFAAKEHVNHLKMLGRLQQDMNSDKGLFASSISQLVDQENDNPSQSNFYKISGRVTKQAVLNYKLVKPEHANDPNQTFNLEINLENLMNDNFTLHWLKSPSEGSSETRPRN